MGDQERESQSFTGSSLVLKKTALTWAKNRVLGAVLSLDDVKPLVCSAVSGLEGEANETCSNFLGALLSAFGTEKAKQVIEL